MNNPFGIQKENKLDTYDKLIDYNMSNNNHIHLTTPPEYFDLIERMVNHRFKNSVVEVDLVAETVNSLQGDDSHEPYWLHKIDLLYGDNSILFFKNYADASDEVQRWIIYFLNSKNYSFYHKIPENMKIIFLDTTEKAEYEKISKHTNNVKKIKFYSLNRKEILSFFSAINIHPLIYAFMLYLDNTTINYYVSLIKELEEISNMLYKSNVLDETLMLSSKRKLDDIVNFAKQDVISLDKILNHEYDSSDIDNLSYSQQRLMIGYLSTVGVENIETVRNFIIQMNPNLVEYFDILWIRSDEDRRAIIEELSKTNNDVIQRKLNNN